jgi:hypothetical protein
MTRSIAAIIVRAVSTHPPRANKTQLPANLSKRLRGRVVLTRPNGKAVYIGRNGGPECATCGSRSELPSLEAFGGQVWLRSFCLALERKRFHRQKGKETPCMSAPRKQATDIAKLPERIAAILAKTVAFRGDAFEVDDAEALVKIMDLINGYDPTMIERMAEKKLARTRRPS